MAFITKQKLILISVIIIIGLPLFLFGTPRFSEYLKEKDAIINVIALKLQIVESIKTSDQLELQIIANKTLSTYLLTIQELCKKQYFQLKTNCELSDLNKSNLQTLSTVLEIGILEIVEAQED
ncbi:MAG: hypothetical protein Q8P72_06615 [Candidatus Roizmanbacteria bacterium]|nr:hypothetical protein [Candidatus Roizmanbacteria bacterium]